jgi:hypothetical protein
MNKKKKGIFWMSTADVLIELGKLIFASFVIGGVLSNDSNRLVIVGVGGAISALVISFGIFLKVAFSK